MACVYVVCDKSKKLEAASKQASGRQFYNLMTFRFSTFAMTIFS